MTDISHNKKAALLMLEGKTAFACWGKIMAVMAALIAVAALLLFVIIGSDEKGDVLGKVKLGVVSMDESDNMDMMFGYVKSIPVMRVICDLEFMGRSEAMKAFEEGDLDMVIMIPNNFLQDAIHMQKTTISVYVPKEDSFANARILSILEGVESVMLTTESSILSMYEGMEYYSYDMTVREMEQSLTDVYVSRFLNRTSLFEEKYLSAYGDLSPVSYYGISLVILLTACFASCFFKLYDPETRRLEIHIDNSGKNHFAFSISKIAVIAVPILVWLFAVLSLLYFVSEAFDLTYFSVNVATYLFCIPIALVIAGTVQLFASAFGTGTREKIMYVLFIILLWLIGGVLGSSYYLPVAMQRLTVVNPASIYVKAMLSGMFGDDAYYAIPQSLTALVIICTAGVYYYSYRLSRSR